MRKKRGNNLIMQMQKELEDGRKKWTKNLPDGQNTRLPINRSSLNKLAERLGWEGATPATSMEGLVDDEDDGPISGITDPIWHLSKIFARKKAHEYTHASSLYGEGGRAIQNPFLRADVDQIVFAICMDVGEAYEPHQKMFTELEPLVIEWVTEGKKAHQRMMEEISNSDGTTKETTSSRGMQEILADALAKGFEIDDGHAGLDIVYTNQEEGDNP